MQSLRKFTWLRFCSQFSSQFLSCFHYNFSFIACLSSVTQSIYNSLCFEARLDRCCWVSDIRVCPILWSETGALIRTSRHFFETNAFNLEYVYHGQRKIFKAQHWTVLFTISFRRKRATQANTHQELSTTFLLVNELPSSKNQGKYYKSTSRADKHRKSTS